VRKVIIIVASILLAILLMIGLFSWYRVNVKITARVDGRKYPYRWREREQKLTEETFNNFEIGMTYTEVVEEIGRQNGELNLNKLIIKIYYEIGYNSFIVLDFYSSQEQPEPILEGIYLYDRDGMIKQIKEDLSNWEN